MRYEEWKARNGTMICHAIYSKEEADAKGLEYVDDWRKAKLGEWTLTDDGYVVEVLRGGADKAGRKWVGTCTMTTSTAPNLILDTEKRENRYSFNGKGRQLPKNLTVELMGFCRDIATGKDPVEAYLDNVAKNRDSNSKQFLSHVRNRVKNLMQHQPVREEIDREVEELLEKADVDKLWLVKKYKHIAEQCENFSAAKSAVDRLSELAGLSAPKTDDTKMLPTVPTASLKEYQPADAEIVAKDDEKEIPSIPKKKPSSEDSLYDGVIDQQEEAS